MISKESDLHILYLTKDCNLRCSYCYEGQEKKQEHMTPDKVEEAIRFIMDKVPSDTRAKILLFGGEPLMNWKGVERALAVCEEYHRAGRGVILTITTNGTLLTQRRVKVLRKHKFFSIQFSIDGDKQTHDACRTFKSGHGSFEMLERNIRYALKYFPFAQARMVISDVNRMYENIVYLVGLGFRDFCIQALRTGTGNQTPEYVKAFKYALEKAYAYVATQNLVRISEVQFPQTDEENAWQEQLAKELDNLHNYFLPDGGRVVQKLFNSEEFQHFSKGEETSYNLLK